MQKEKLVGGLLGDCWIERQSKGPNGNARVGLQLTQNTVDYFNNWSQTFLDWLENKSNQVVLKSVGQGQKFKQLTARTRSHPAFTELYYVYRPNDGPKLVPALPWLELNFTTVSFAELMMQDGSRHGLNAAAGFTIHSQGFTFEGNSRLAILLNEKFNLYAWPTRHIKRDTVTGKVSHVYWNVYISSDSYATMESLVKPLMLPSLASQKFHPNAPAPKATPNSKNQAANFLARFQSNVSLRQDVGYQVPRDAIQDYAQSLFSNPNQTPLIEPEI